MESDIGITYGHKSSKDILFRVRPIGSKKKGRGEPRGWPKVRLPVLLFEAIREMGAELVDAQRHRRGRLPRRYIEAGRVPAHYVIARCLARDIAHRARSTTGKRQKQLFELWRRVAEEAGLPPFEM